MGWLKYLIFGQAAAGNGSDELGSNDELLGGVFTSVDDEILSSNPNLGWLKYLLLGRQAGRLAGNGSGELGSNDELLGDVFTSVDGE